MWIILKVDDSHEVSSIIFSEKYKKKTIIKESIIIKLINHNKHAEDLLTHCILNRLFHIIY